MSDTNTPQSQSPKLCRGLFAEIRELVNQARDQAMRDIMTPLDCAPVVVRVGKYCQYTVTGVEFSDSIDGKKLLVLSTADDSTFPGDYPKEPEAVTTEEVTGLDPSQPLPGEVLPSS